jgi:hypothetical protein
MWDFLSLGVFVVTLLCLVVFVITLSPMSSDQSMRRANRSIARLGIRVRKNACE